MKDPVLNCKEFEAIGTQHETSKKRLSLWLRMEVFWSRE